MSLTRSRAIELELDIAVIAVLLAHHSGTTTNTIMKTQRRENRGEEKTIMNGTGTSSANAPASLSLRIAIYSSSRLTRDVTCGSRGLHQAELLELLEGWPERMAWM